ncbi:unnamed protein product [Aphis gossypii]|uniref:Uncharacterized protein n=1 Tax=Aphis gossypii TaxID=80765 RepID=A0A9P0NIY3_APHGO|nr:unnamed protein product [Aphis gossypii]
MENVKMAVPVVSPDEEPILTLAPSAELMTEAISFVETDTNAPVETITHDIETPGPVIEKVKVAPPVLCPVEKQTLSPCEENGKEATIIDTDKTVPLRKKKKSILVSPTERSPQSLQDHLRLWLQCNVIKPPS